MKKCIKIMIQERFNDLTEHEGFTADKILHVMYGYLLALFDIQKITYEELMTSTLQLCEWRLDNEEC